MNVLLVAIEPYWTRLRRELFPPGNTHEHFGFGIAGISCFEGTCHLLLRRFIVADRSCVVKQSGVSVKPDPRFVEYVWKLARHSRASLIDFHTHPFSDSHVRFSGIDDRSEYANFPEIVKYLGDGPHASVVLGRNSLDARWYDAGIGQIKPISMVRVLGENLQTIIPTSASQHSRGEPRDTGKEDHGTI